MRKWPGHVMLSGSEESEVGHASRLVEPDASLPLSMTCPGHFLIACRKKGPLACHAERERSIWSHQAGGVAHLGFFAALRMTCPGHFLMACYEKPVRDG